MTRPDTLAKMPEEENNGRRKRRPLERMSYAERGRFFKTRNILNLVFIILAIAGMAVYFYTDKTAGSAMLIVCVFIKLAKCVFCLISCL